MKNADMYPRVRHSSVLNFKRIAPLLTFLTAALSPWTARAATPTTITLAITAAGAPVSSVASLTAVALTATVTAAGTPVTPGQVKFCDAAAAFCVDTHLIATAQLTSGGVASFKFIPGPGVHSYKAIFAGTTQYASSTSSTASLTVTGQIHSNTTLTSSGTRGNYTLAATVYGAGASAPTGDVSFIDQTRSNTVLTTSSLVAASPGLNFSAPTVSPLNLGSGESVTIADFNGDGIPDLFAPYLYIHPDGGNCEAESYFTDIDRASIFLGNGDGTFTLGVTNLMNGCDAASAAVGDFNGDGLADIVVGSSGGDLVTVLLGDGTGHFTPKSQSSLLYGTFVAVGDFNGDGNADIATLDTYAGVTVALGDGTGSFAPQQAFSVYGQSMVVGDFNGDGILDIAASSYNSDKTPSGTIVVLLGVGNGTFVAGSVTNLPDGKLISLAMADFNGDGKFDLAAVNGNKSVSILLGDGLGNFSTSTISLPTTAASVSATDLNGDGYVDLIVPGNAGNGESPVLLGDGTGGFQLTSLPTTTYATSFAVGDLNADGLPDLVSLNSSGDLNPLLTDMQTAVATATSITPTPVGSDTHLVVASYAGDSTYLASTSPQIGLTTAQGTPQVALTASANPAAYGFPLTFTATVTGVGDQPTGTVNFFNGLTPLGSGTLSAGIATLTTSTLTTGSYSITASYLGDTNYLAAISSPISLTVTVLPTPAISLTSSTASASYGSPVTLTATATGTSGVPTGSVTFTDGSIKLGMATLNAGGVASLTTSSLPGGTSSVTAGYPGSIQYSPATSTAINIAVAKATPTITLVSSASTINLGAGITYTATVSGVGATPTGSVQFMSGNTPLGSVSVSAGGVASYPITWPTPGEESITAVYTGDSNYVTATSSAVTVTIYGLTTPAITLVSSATSVAYGSSISLHVSLVGQQATPTGTMTFLDGTATLGSQPLDATGSATLSSSALAIGSNSIRAVYSGDSLNAAITSTPVSVTVTTTLTLIATTTTLYTGSSDTVTITVAGVAGKPTPTGSITLTGGGFTSAATALSGGSASITIPANTLPFGNVTLTATYSGDSIYPTSSGSLQIDVTSTPPSFTIGGDAVTLAAGATTGNTAKITITPQAGFIGSVVLSAAISASPSGAIDLPTLSFGSTSPLNLSGTAAGTATLTIATTAPTTTAAQASRPTRSGWYAIGSTALACLVIFGIPARRRSLQKMLGILLLLAFCAGGVVSCGGGGSGGGRTTNPGTTPGTYQVKITATSGSISVNNSISVTVR